MIKYEELNKQLDRKDYQPLYLLMGEEPYYIDRLCERFENEVIDADSRNFNQLVFYGQDSAGTDIAASAKQYPFGSDRLLVVVKEAKKLKEFNALVEYAKNPIPSTILVVCYKYGKAVKEAVKAFESAGVVFQSDPVRDWDIPKWILGLAKEFQFQLDANTAELLAEHMGNDLSHIYSEFGKLCLVLPAGSTITPDVVEQHIGINKEYNIFELQEALGAKNKARAYKITLNFTQHLKENPNIKTIAMLSRFFGNMIAFHLTPNKNDKEAVMAAFNTKNAFIANKNTGYARNYSLPELTNIISILREYDLKSKGLGSNADDGELLKEMMMKIMER
jgi:DNA polymerase-3 subunit delta